MRVNRVLFTLAAFVLLLTNAALRAENDNNKPKAAFGKLQVEIDGEESLVNFYILKDCEDIARKGRFFVTPENETEKTYLEIRHYLIDSNFSWFAARCVKDPHGDNKGKWLFVLIHDDGSPGELFDHIWWEWIDEGNESEKIAVEKIKKMAKPKNNLAIKDGEIEIDD